MPVRVRFSRAGLLTVCLLCQGAAVASQAADPTASTPHLDRAVELVRRQADHMSRGRKSVSAEFFASLATANFVQSRLSSLNYSRRATAEQKLPTSVEECLQMNAGICGNHVATFLEIARRLELRARPVEFYFRGERPDTNHSHICAEVFYRNRWRLFDITWGTFFRRPGGGLDDLAGIEELRSNRMSRAWAITNQSDLWYQQWKATGLDPLEYLHHARVDILRGRKGTIHLEAAVRDGTSAVYQPLHQPNFVGRNSADRDYGPLTMQLEATPAEATVLQLEVLGRAGRGELVVSCGPQRSSIPFDDLPAGQMRTVRFPRPLGKHVVRVQTTAAEPGGVAYVVFRKMTLETR